VSWFTLYQSALLGVVGIGQDITGRIAQEREYSKLIDSANAPIFGVDTLGVSKLYSLSHFLYHELPSPAPLLQSVWMSGISGKSLGCDKVQNLLLDFRTKLPKSAALAS
jgi:hypothetical protein